MTTRTVPAAWTDPQRIELEQGEFVAALHELLAAPGLTDDARQLLELVHDSGMRAFYTAAALSRRTH